MKNQTSLSGNVTDFNLQSLARNVRDLSVARTHVGELAKAFFQKIMARVALSDRQRVSISRQTNNSRIDVSLVVSKILATRRGATRRLSLIRIRHFQFSCSSPSDSRDANCFAEARRISRGREISIGGIFRAASTMMDRFRAVCCGPGVHHGFEKRAKN